MPRRSRRSELWRRAAISALVAAVALGCGREVRRTSYAGGRPWSEVHYKDGAPDGVWRTWWENGQEKSEGGFRAGALEGPWRTWFEDGAPQTEQLFVRGQPHGMWRHWYATGGLLTEGAYAGGRKTGWWREWYGDGTPKAEGEFEDGIQTGTATTYFPDGRMKTRTRYDAQGVQEHLEVWNEGQEGGWSRAEGPIVNDQRNGLWNIYNIDGSVNEEFSGLYKDGVLVKEGG